MRRYGHSWDHFAEEFEVCTATVRKTAYSHGLRSCKRRAKLWLGDGVVLQRLEWAREIMRMEWRRAIFSDDSCFELGKLSSRPVSYVLLEG